MKTLQRRFALNRLSLMLLPISLLACGAAVAGTTYTTQGASNVTSNSATLNGTASSTCAVGNISFSYGATAGYGFSASATPAAINTETRSVTGTISGLVCNSTYHYKLTGDTCAPSTDGADQTFTTAALGSSTGVAATVASPTSASVSWTAPASNCGSAITGYTVKAVQDPAKTCTTTTATTCNVTGLTSGTAYSFTVTAVNGNGIGDTSVASNSVTPGNTQTITGFVASPANGTVGGTSSLSAAGGASGSAITFGTTTSSVCSVTGSTVRYLTAGTCTVTANQAAGGSYSAAAQVTLNITSSSTSSAGCYGITNPGSFSISPCVNDMTSGTGLTALNGIASTLTNKLGLANVRNLSQGSNGTVVAQYDGGKLAFMPINIDSRDTRANGVYDDAFGTYALVNNGTAVTVAPGILNFNEISTLLSGWDVQIDRYGIITASNNGTTYSVKPAYFVQNDTTVGPRLSAGSDGFTRFVDSAGNSQILYPAFSEPDSLLSFLRFEDSQATAAVQLDGTIQAKLNGKTYTLTPDVTLLKTDTANVSGTRWMESLNRYRMRLLKRLNMTQGFGMQ